MSTPNPNPRSRSERQLWREAFCARLANNRDIRDAADLADSAVYKWRERYGTPETEDDPGSPREINWNTIKALRGCIGMCISAREAIAKYDPAMRRALENAIAQGIDAMAAYPEDAPAVQSTESHQESNQGSQGGQDA